jgi:glutamate carboxypeptidase
MSEPDRGITVNIGPLKGGGATNVVPDHAACWGNVRFPDAAAGETLGVLLDTLVTTGDALPKVTVHRAWNRPAKPLIPAVEKMATTIQEAASDLDQTIHLTSTGGVCDGNMLQQLGVPTLDTLGIRGGNLHRLDEWIEVDSLCERAALLAVSIHRLVAAASQ